MRTLIVTVLAIASFVLSGGSALADTPVNFLSYHYNPQRQGWNPNEKVLNPSIVATPAFGELWNSPKFDTFSLSGTQQPVLYAVPLYVDSVTLTNAAYSGITLSVIYAGTTNGDLYAVCAQGYQDPSGSPSIPAGTILWHDHLGDPEVSSDNSIPRGILGTPVIDLNHNPPLVYVASDVANLGWRVFAIDITNGNFQSGWPISVNDTTVSPVLLNGPAPFGTSGKECQRGGLNLSADGTMLYVPFGDYSDNSNGYMLVVNTVTPGITVAFAGCPSGNPTPSAPYAGMWAAAGPAIDSAGHLFTTTGNCPVPNPPSSDQISGFWGMSVLEFSGIGSHPLSLIGTYTPWNYPAMDVNDTDLCGSSAIVLPDLPGLTPHLVAVGGKQGNGYLLNRDSMPGGLIQRPATNLTSNQDQSLLNPAPQSYYNNQVGPLNVFGPYSENSNQTDFAKSRTTPAFFQAADGSAYLIFTGATKQAIGNRTPVPPGVVRVKINTSASSPAYLSIDKTENTQAFFSAGSPIISSNGSANPISWNLDANVYRTDNLRNSKPYLVGVDVTTMQTVFKSSIGTLHAGAKYNEPSVARGMVIVGTDRLQVFGVTSSIYSINCGGIATGTYQADAYFTGGQTTSTVAAIDVTGVTNPAPAAVYQTARTDNTGAGFTYTFPGLTPGGSYPVRLHFSEPVFSTANARKFNVAINGNPTLINYDIFATAGAANKAVTEPFEAIADNSGTITINFSAGTGGTSSNNPIVSGIQVLQIPGTNPVLIAPVSGSKNGTPMTVTYFLPTGATPGTLKLNFDDGTTVRTLTLANALGVAGSNTIIFPPGNPTGSNAIVSGVPIPDGTYTLTLGYTDIGSGSPVTSAPVASVLIDTTPPTISAPVGGFTPNPIYNTPGGNAIMPDYTGQAVASDNSGTVVVTQSPAPGISEIIGQYTVTLTATDPSGNTATTSFTLAVLDYQGVLLTDPTTGSDKSGTLSVSYSLPGVPKTHSVFLRFDDGSTLRDVVFANGVSTPGPHTVIFSTGNPAASNSVFSGPPIPDGTYTLTMFFQDQVGDGPISSTPATNVIIDSTPPTISAPAGGFVPNPLVITQSGTAALPDYTGQVTAGDNFGAPTLTQSPAPGTFESVQQLQVTVTAMDGAGNTSHVSFQLNVIDYRVLLTAPATGPHNGGPLTLTYSIPANAKPQDQGGLVLRFDDGTNQHDIVVANAASNAGVHTFAFTPGNPTGSSNIFAGSGIPDGTYTVTLRLLDAGGDPVQVSSPVTGVIVDATPPSIGGPIDFTPRSVVVDSNGHATVPNYLAQIAPFVTDNIHLSSVTQDPPAGTSEVIGPVTITFTATDEAGNTATTDFSLQVVSGATQYSQVLNGGDAVPGAGTDPTIPAGSLFKTFGVPAINDAGTTAVAATWAAGKVKGSGILAGSPLKVVADLLSPVPDTPGAVWKTFTDPVIDSAGHIAFLATIGGKGIPASTVLVSDAFTGALKIIAQTGGISPSPDQAKYKSFLAYSLRNDKATVVANLATGTGAKVTGANNQGVFQLTSTGGSQLVRKGATATLSAGSSALKTLRLFASVAGSPAQGRDEDASGTSVAYIGGFVNKATAVMEGDSPLIEAKTSNLLDSPAGAQWATFGAYSLDGDASTRALQATMTVGPGSITKLTSSGIFLNTSGTFSAIAQTNSEDAPGMSAGVKFSKFSDPVVADDGSGVAFIATVKGSFITSGNNTGIWWKPTGQPLKLVARTGTPDDSVPGGSSWKKFTSLALPGGGAGPLFTATIATGHGVTAASAFGLWGVDPMGITRSLLREEDGIQNQPVRTLSVLQPVKASPGVTRNFNNTGSTLVRVTYTNGNQGIVEITVP